MLGGRALVIHCLARMHVWFHNMYINTCAPESRHQSLPVSSVYWHSHFTDLYLLHVYVHVYVCIYICIPCTCSLMPVVYNQQRNNSFLQCEVEEGHKTVQPNGEPQLSICRKQPSGLDESPNEHISHTYQASQLCWLGVWHYSYTTCTCNILVDLHIHGVCVLHTCICIGGSSWEAMNILMIECWFVNMSASLSNKVLDITPWSDLMNPNICALSVSTAKITPSVAQLI